MVRSGVNSAEAVKLSAAADIESAVSDAVINFLKNTLRMCFMCVLPCLSDLIVDKKVFKHVSRVLQPVSRVLTS